jgi:hypothetical protein
MAGKNGQGAVNLLGEYHAGQLMWQRQTAKGQKKIGLPMCLRRPSIRGTNGEYEPLGSLIPDPPNVLGELLGRVLLAATVEQDRIRSAAWLAIQPVENGGL